MTNNEEIEIIDWSLVTKRLSGVLGWLGRWYLPAVIFLVLLSIVTYGFPAPVIRQLLLFVLVGLSILVWLLRVLLRRENIIWQSSPLSWPGLAVIAVVLINSFVASDPALPWGLRGGLSENGPLAWLSAIGLAFLVVQSAKAEAASLRRVLFAYLSASSLLAVFIIVWWLGRQELITPAIGLFSSAALWFAVNTLVLSVATLLWRGRIRKIALALVVLHLLVLFGYDFDLAWYLLAGGGLVFSVGQLLFEKRLPRVDFRLSFGLIIISVVLLFVPVKWLAPKLGFDSSAIQTVSTQVAWPRYYNNIIKTDPLFGTGLGGGSESFWNLAELVDMRQVGQFPNIGNGYMTILWEGGLILLGVFIFLILSLLRSLYRVFSVRGGDVLNLAVFLGFLGWVVVFALVPVDFMIFFSFGLFAGLSGVICSKERLQVAPRPGARSFLIFSAVILGLFILAVASLAIFEGAGRLNFIGSVKTDKSGTSIDLQKLDKAVSGHGWVFGYRLARIDFMVQAISEAKKTNPDFKAERVGDYLKTLQDDFQVVGNANLLPRQFWFLGWDAEQIGALLTDDSAKEWFKLARVFYEKGLASFPRNVIIFTDVARFYRMRAESILRENETKDALYRLSYALLDKALGIDNTYEQAFMERSQLLLTEGKNEEAFESLKPLADKNPAASYGAGHLAFSSKKFEEAVAYFKKAIEQNTNHLQARYELVQAYLALSDLKSAQEELEALEKLAPKDDAATQELLKGLKELLK